MGIDIGPLHVADPVILAPMSGVTDMPFRRLVKRSGAGLVVSEMIASQAMIRHSRQGCLSPMTRRWRRRFGSGSRSSPPFSG